MVVQIGKDRIREIKKILLMKSLGAKKSDGKVERAVAETASVTSVPAASVPASGVQIDLSKVKIEAWRGYDKL